jgi:hypothetical protein
MDWWAVPEKMFDLVDDTDLEHREGAPNNTADVDTPICAGTRTWRNRVPWKEKIKQKF